MYQVLLPPNSLSEGVRGYSRFVHDDTTFDYVKITYVNKEVPAQMADDSLIVVASIANKDSYGDDKKFADFMSTIQSYDYDLNAMSLGIYVGDKDEFQRVDTYMRAYFDLAKTAPLGKPTINKATILMAPFLEQDYNNIDRNDRHNDNVQRLRRRNIARTRNFALLHTLAEERYTLFMDADVVKIQNTDMLRRFIASKKDIIVPRIIRGGNIDYDRNSWVGERTVPSEEQLAKMDRNEWDSWDYVPRDIPGKMDHFEDFIKRQADVPQDHASRQPDYMVKLDLVGGAILFAKSMIYKQGVVFPPNYIVGTTWKRLEGYDGIETEGLCYTAKSLNYECWGMPNMVGEHVA